MPYKKISGFRYGKYLSIYGVNHMILRFDTGVCSLAEAQCESILISVKMFGKDQIISMGYLKL
jgi:hypothetical protein